jgi:hypothetical protein
MQDHINETNTLTSARHHHECVMCGFADGQSGYCTELERSGCFDELQRDQHSGAHFSFSCSLILLTLVSGA